MLWSEVTLAAMTGFLRKLQQTLGLGSGDASPPPNVYADLRRQALGIRPEDLGMTAGSAPPVHGVLMDMGFATGVATLVCMGDGTVSLYNSGGGGVIGAGQHKAVSDVAMMMLAFAEQFVSSCEPAQAYPVPGAGQIHFWLLTAGGVMHRHCSESDLVDEQDPMTELFKACHSVLTEVRRIEQAG